MTTNPNNAVGTNGAYSGRTSPNAFNDVLAIMGGRGVVSGWACSPDSGMDVTIGGNGSVRDVAVAEDNAGNRVTVNNISQAPISLTIPAAPASNSRIDAIVAYVENPPMGTSTDTDNPGPVGLIIVSGAVASTPTVPDDNTIRTAITADGAAGATAYYVILATVTVANGTTTITSGLISAGANAFLDKTYPVGSIYMSATLSTPAQVATALGGGTWVAWGAGRVPVGVDTNDTDFDTTEETGGSKTHRHDFKIGTRFWYGVPIGDSYANNDQGAWSYSQSKFSKSHTQITGSISCSRNSALTASISAENPDIHESVGDTDTSSSLQPYITCYMYKRTA